MSYFYINAIRGTNLAAVSLIFLFEYLQFYCVRVDMRLRRAGKCTTRGIWKVLSMVLYLSNRFTDPIMFGLILKRYLSSMLWHKFYEDIIMQTRNILL